MHNFKKHMFSTFVCLSTLSNAQVTLKEEISVFRTNDSVQFTMAVKDNYKIFIGTSPKDIDWEVPVATIKDRSAIWVTKQFRPYFGIINSKNDTLIVSERKIPFRTAENFRDLGGIKNSEGKTIVWGTFYRGDELSGLSESELKDLASLKIKNVYDLRGEDEIKANPDRLTPGMNYIHNPIFDGNEDASFKNVEEKIKNGTMTSNDARQLLTDANIGFVKNHSPKFKELITNILNAEDPVLYHCSAGKDRTGFVSALILSVLKVDRQTILDEYEMTNFYTKDKIEKIIHRAEQGKSFFPNMKPEVLETLMGVDRSYIHAAFDLIDQEYGGIDAYIRNQLEISDRKRKEYIDRYTF